MKNRETANKAIESLRKIGVEPGMTIYSVIRSVSRSGMRRWIDFFIIRNGIPLRITWSMAEAIGATYDRKREALVVNGCGMDMAFHCVNSLSIAMFCKGGYTHEGAYSLKSEII